MTCHLPLSRDAAAAGLKHRFVDDARRAARESSLELALNKFVRWIGIEAGPLPSQNAGGAPDVGHIQDWDDPKNGGLRFHRYGSC